MLMVYDLDFVSSIELNLYLGAYLKQHFLQDIAFIPTRFLFWFEKYVPCETIKHQTNMSVFLKRGPLDSNLWQTWGRCAPPMETWTTRWKDVLLNEPGTGWVPRALQPELGKFHNFTSLSDFELILVWQGSIICSDFLIAQDKRK